MVTLRAMANRCNREAAGDTRHGDCGWPRKCDKNFSCIRYSYMQRASGSSKRISSLVVDRITPPLCYGTRGTKQAAATAE